MEFVDYLQAITDGVMQGAYYALIGIGFTLIFGVMNKINLAYAAAAFGGHHFRFALELHAGEQAGHVALDVVEQFLKELEGLALVFLLRLLLGVGAQMDALAQVIHSC